MISVCLASFNGEKYIEQQIKSILLQLSDDDELIISDNGSTDRTIDIVNSFNDNRIKLFNHLKRDNKFLGFTSNHYVVSSNFENAIKRAQGDIIFLSDQDDIWEEDKVLTTLNLLNEFDLIISNCSVIDENNEMIESSFFKDLGIAKGLIKNILNPSFHGCCMAFRQSLLDIVLPFPRHLILHDTWIGLLAFKFFKVHYTPKTLVKYRRHLSNASSEMGKSKNSFIFKCFYRFALLIQIYVRVWKIKGI